MRFLRIGLLVTILLGLILGTLPVYADDHGDDSNIERILVKFEDGTDEESEREVSRRHGDSDEGEIRGTGVRVIRIPRGRLQEKLQAYSREKGVIFAEPDYIAHAYGTPDDTYFGNQWGMTRVQAPSAWDVTTGQTTVTIAILDTGIDQNHPDLAGKVINNRNFTSSATVDDLYGHGTHVAGVAAAATNNAMGVAGVGYNTALMNVKVLDDNGSGAYSWIANGIIWATDNGAKVISMSLGGSSGSSTLQSAINYAVSRGVVVVAAAGNSGNSAPSYPAYYSGVIAVAASDANDATASFSNHGSWVDVAAPGTGIYSTLPNHSNRIGILNYGSLSGTSMATPFVAGLAGLVWSTPYGTDGASVRNRIESTADRVGGTGTYWQYGRINAYSAVAPSVPPPPPDTTPPAQVNGLVVTTANSSQLNLQWTANTESDLQNYRVYRAATSGGPYTLIASPITNSYASTGLSASTTYYYVASAVDAAGNEGARSVEAAGATSAAPINKMHVHSITVTLRRDGNYTRAQAVMTILDANGAPVAGAFVSGHWSGATSDTDSGTTNTSGQLTEQSNRVRRPPTGTTYTFTVDNVVRSGWTYDAAANVETSDSAQVP